MRTPNTARRNHRENGLPAPEPQEFASEEDEQLKARSPEALIGVHDDSRVS
jgi:hypothetical protein